jgi:hypothetical protein
MKRRGVTQMLRPRVAFTGGVLISRTYEISAAKIGIGFWLALGPLVGLGRPVRVGFDERLPSTAAGTRASARRQHGHAIGHGAIHGRGALGDGLPSDFSADTHWCSRPHFW